MRDPAMGEPRKRQTRMDYARGPMGFLASQIVKEMQRAGYPASVHAIYRSPEDQQKMVERRVSKAPPFSSAHQYYGAADIIHERFAWFDPSIPNVPDGSLFWARLWDCVEVVGEKYNVAFRPQIIWDPAHVELKNWRDVRKRIGQREPSATTLAWYFENTLPSVWKAHREAQHKKGC